MSELELRIGGVLGGAGIAFLCWTCVVASWRDLHEFPIPFMFAMMASGATYVTVRVGVVPLIRDAIDWHRRRVASRPRPAIAPTDPYRQAAEREVETLLRAERAE